MDDVFELVDLSLLPENIDSRSNDNNYIYNIVSKDNLVKLVSLPENVDSKNINNYIYNIVSESNMVNYNINKDSFYYIKGRLFENDDTTLYSNTKIIVQNMLGETISSYKSTDGEFNISGLPNQEINLVVIDGNNKYTGKYIPNITPTIDYQKALNIIQIYKTDDHTLFRIVYNGSHTLTLTGSGTLHNIDEYHYEVSKINGNFTLTLVDYINTDAYILEKKY